MEPRVLVTGGDGYLGRRIARRFLEEGRRVLLWLRAKDSGELAAKRQALAADLSSFGDRVEYAGGDLRAEDPFPGIDPASVAAIVHGAAVIRFNVDEETARRVNVEGTARVLSFAERCDRLETLALVSTIYASGLRAGPVEEAPLPRDGFANHYESSKWAAEDLLLTRHPRLPWRIFRVATVIADDEAGKVTQYNAVHNTLQLLYYGLMSTVPGRPDTPVYLVTGDLAAEAVQRLAGTGAARSVYHVAHRREQSLTLERLLETAFEAFAEDESFRRRRVLRPLYADQEAFELLRQALSTFAGGPVNQAVSSVSPFAAQLFVTKEVRNDRLIAGLGADPAPDPIALVRNTCRHLVRTRWGRQGNAA